MSSLLGVQDQPHKIETSVDKTLCTLHKLKKTFFCEHPSCLYELCFTCRDKHEKGHPIKFIEETAKFVSSRFKDSLDYLTGLKQELNVACNDDPTQHPVAEGQFDVLERGNKEIDLIFEKVFKHVEQAKIDMKARLKEAYIANYKTNLDLKAQSFLNNIDKLEKYVNTCIQDFERRQTKGKFLVVAYQRPKVDELWLKLEKLKSTLTAMCENSRDFKQDF